MLIKLPAVLMLTNASVHVVAAPNILVAALEMDYIHAGLFRNVKGLVCSRIGSFPIERDHYSYFPSADSSAAAGTSADSPSVVPHSWTLSGGVVEVNGVRGIVVGGGVRTRDWVWAGK